MDLFEKQDNITKTYDTRKYTIDKLANEFNMTKRDVVTVLRLNNYYHGIKQSPDNMKANRYYNFCISEKKLKSIRTL